MADFTRVELEALFEQRLADAFASLGCFNLAVFGKTGVGKSTLVNAIFGENVAPTGMGQPVTKGLQYYRHPGGFLGVYDSEGFETGTAGDAIIAGLGRIVAEHRDKPVAERIHAAWYLVRWSDRRFEQPQADFVRSLVSLGVPTFIVLTQVPTRPTGEGAVVHPEALEFASYINAMQLPIAHPVLLSNALADAFSGAPVFGLQDLLDATYQVVPEAAASALTAAQVVDIDRKRKAARSIINQAVAVAGGVGAAPIPFADAALLVPNQVTMIARITAAYGLPIDKSRALAVTGSIALTGGATLAGRYAVTTLLKAIPGGAIVGSVVSAGVASVFTKAVGMAWARVCEHVLSLPPSERDSFLNGSAAAEMFTKTYRLLAKGKRLDASPLPSGGTHGQY